MPFARKSQIMTALPESGGVIACLTLAPVFWGGNFVVGSILAHDLPAHWTNLLRWLIAAAVLLPFCGRAVWQYRQALSRSWRQLMVLSVLGVAGFNTVLYTGLKTAPVSVAAVAFAVTPFLITAFVAAVNRELPSGRFVAAAVIAFTGMLLAHWSSFHRGTPADGILLVLLAALIWAAYCVGLRRYAFAFPARASFFAQVVIGTIVLVPIALATQDPPALSRLDGQQWLGLLYLGVFAAALAFWLWQRGVARAGAARASIFMNLVPISSLALSFAFLGMPVSRAELFAFSLVLFGICLSSPNGPRLPRFRARGALLVGVTLVLVSVPRGLPADPVQQAYQSYANCHLSAADARAPVSAGCAIEYLTLKLAFLSLQPEVWWKLPATDRAQLSRQGRQAYIEWIDPLKRLGIGNLER